jgi:probable rRNA maturation factor
VILNIFKEVKTRVPRARLQQLLTVVARREKVNGWRGAVNLVFVGDARMRKLNQNFRKIDRTTDVLSFNLDDGKTADSTLGEIYISMPQARRQARQYGGSLSAEYLRLAVHGLLHLLGYDHGKPSEEKKMMMLQDEYLERLRGSRQ